MQNLKVIIYFQDKLRSCFLPCLEEEVKELHFDSVHSVNVCTLLMVSSEIFMLFELCFI